MSEHYFNSKQKIERHVNRRFHVVLGIAIACLFALILRLAYLQVIKHHEYTTLSEKNYLAMIPIPASRGIIYDRHHHILASNRIVYQLLLSPEHLKNQETILNDLESILHFKPSELESLRKIIVKHRHSATPIVIKDQLSDEAVAKYYLNQFRLTGLSLQPYFFRDYPDGYYDAHLIGHIGHLSTQDLSRIDGKGYTGDDTIGKTGLEYTLEKTLHGKIGYQQVEVDASGQVIRVLKKQDPVPGEDITLTIDQRLQNIAHQAMQGYEGSVIALDAKTGGVLAMVSHPSFNPNIFVKGVDSDAYKALQRDPDKPLYNRSTQGLYAPGSTIKPFMAYAALKQHVITPTTTFNDPGWYQLPDSTHQYRDWNWDRGGHGRVNIEKALIVSCDTFFYRVAYELGISRLSESLQAFGFGQPTTIEIPNQYTGVVPTPTWKLQHNGLPWYRGDTVITGIGQGFMLTTPIQLAQATMTFANHGTAHPITLLLDKANHEAIAHDPSHDILIDPDLWQIINRGLEGVINSTHPWGTGVSFGRHPPYSVAAKTGTAQVYSIKNRHQEEHVDQSGLPKKLRDNALFIEYTPTDSPDLVVVVVIEHTWTSVAAQVARKITDAYYHLQKKDASDV